MQETCWGQNQHTKPVRAKELGLTGVRAAIVVKKSGNADGCEGTVGKQRP